MEEAKPNLCCMAEAKHKPNYVEAEGIANLKAGKMILEIELHTSEIYFTK